MQFLSLRSFLILLIVPGLILMLYLPSILFKSCNTGSQNSNGKFNTVIDETLERHNFYRQKHNVPPLRISSKLNAISEEWANNLAERNEFFHRPNNKYGENLYYIQSTTEVTKVGVTAVNSWYSEIEFFDFEGTSAEMDSATRAFHFTQLVWKSSKELGVGVAECPESGKTYVVCNYDPPGNFMKRFKENVLPSHA